MINDGKFDFTELQLDELEQRIDDLEKRKVDLETLLKGEVGPAIKSLHYMKTNYLV